MGCASSAPTLSRNGELNSTAEGLVQQGTGLAGASVDSITAKAKETAEGVKDEAVGKLKGNAMHLHPKECLIHVH